MAQETLASREALDTLRHSASHIMAEAVQKLFPDAKLGIGPAIENGFYYDFSMAHRLTDEDLARIEDAMKVSIAANKPFVCEEMSSADAIAFFEGRGEAFKVELIKDLATDKVSIYKHGDFVDLCKGPHVVSTAKVQNFKLMSVAGAYWRGDEKRPMLQRIYATAFVDRQQLKDYLTQLEEAKLRDHRKIGPEMRLFDIYQDDAGAGFVFYLENGYVLKRLIEDWELREHKKRGYVTVQTPLMLDRKLFETSGHVDHYSANMYPVEKDDVAAFVKPMNCPGHMLVYKSQMHSYRDLPLRMFEMGTVYRHEKTGALHGLLRVRGFTQDDAHIFCREEQLADEIKAVLAFVKDAMALFGFTYTAELSTRPEKGFIGEIKTWDLAEGVLLDILKNGDVPYVINHGDGAFYGPKIDIKLKDAIGRSWQCATVQLDLNLPTRFDLSYIAEDGSKKTPIMLHRVILGSYERFIACLIEHYKGAFPFWLSPVQAKVLALKSTCNEGAARVAKMLEEKGYRVELDTREETLNKKIREAELSRVPYIVIIGEQELAKNTVNVRTRGKKTLGERTHDELLALFDQEPRG
jgi:threonyl-tRNA synthetase